MRLLALGVLAGLCLVASTSGASAASLDVPLLSPPDRYFADGPVLFGDDLLWLDVHETETLVRERDPRGRVRTRLTIRDRQGSHFYSGIFRVGRQLMIVGSDRTEYNRIVARRTWVAAPGTPAVLVQASPCTRAVGDDYVLAETTIGAGSGPSGCDEDRMTITGTGPASGITRTLPEWAEVAGHLFAYVDDEDTLHVQDWVTGRDVYGIPGAPDRHPRWGLTLGEDGTIVFHDDVPEYNNALIATVADPTPRTAPWLDDIEPILAGGYTAALNEGLLTIATPTGHVLGKAKARSDEFDFDGQRAAWRVKPCGVNRLVVWNIDEPPAKQPSNICGLLRLRTRKSVTIHHRTVPPHALAVHLHCPAASNGCAGDLSWTMDDRILTEFAKRLNVDLRPGESRTVIPHVPSRWPADVHKVVVHLDSFSAHKDRAQQRTIAIHRR